MVVGARHALIGLLALASCGGPSRGDSPTSPDSSTSECEAPQPEPHVVVVLLDDVGWTGLSGGQTSRGLGSDYHETPRLDALADQGVAFSAAYASPQCQPSRAALLTGQHAARTKMYANFESNRADPDLRSLDAPPTLERLPLEAVTLAELLAEAGWRTGHFGKWHIGVDGADGPVEQGFELNVGGTDGGSISGGSDDHWSYADGHFDLPNMGPTQAGRQFAADRITDEAIAFLDADLTRPGFVFLSHWSVHTPLQSPEPDLAPFQDKPAGTHHSEPVYAGMLHNLDGNVGRLVDWLETTEDPRQPCHTLIENTLLVVLSDNGAAGGYASEGVTTSREISNQLPLRSGKGTAWEGGLRVPMMIRWDRGGAAGRIVDEPVQHVDVVPTVLDLSGVASPSHPIDGISLRAAVSSQTEPLGRTHSFFHFPAYLDYIEADITDRLRETPSSTVWSDRWKLMWRYETSEWELYDLEEDIAETTNVAVDHPEIVQDLGAALVDWLVATDADLPLQKGTTNEVGLPDPMGGR